MIAEKKNALKENFKEKQPKNVFVKLTKSPFRGFFFFEALPHFTRIYLTV